MQQPQRDATFAELTKEKDPCTEKLSSSQPMVESMFYVCSTESKTGSDWGVNSLARAGFPGWAILGSKHWRTRGGLIHLGVRSQALGALTASVPSSILFRMGQKHRQRRGWG